MGALSLGSTFEERTVPPALVTTFVDFVDRQAAAAIRSSPSGLTALCAGRTGLFLVLIGYVDRTTAAFNASVAETRYADTTPWRQFGRDRRGGRAQQGIQLA